MLKTEKSTKYFKIGFFTCLLLVYFFSPLGRISLEIFLKKGRFEEFVSLFAFSLSLSLGFNFIALSGKINLSLPSAILIGELFVSFFAIRLKSPILAVLLGGLFAIPISFLFSYLANYLEEKFSLDTVVSSLLTNYIVLYLVGFINFSLLRDKASSSMASKPFLTGSAFPLGIIISLIFLAIYSYIYRRTVFGEILIISGKNRKMAELLGFKPKLLERKAVFLGASFASLSGMVFLLENSKTLEVQDPLIFWDACLISITSKGDPLLTLIVAFIFSLLKVSFSVLSRRENISYELVIVLQTLFIVGLLIYRNRRVEVDE